MFWRAEARDVHAFVLEELACPHKNIDCYRVTMLQSTYPKHVTMVYLRAYPSDLGECFVCSACVACPSPAT